VSQQTTGKIVNLMSVDASYISDSISILKLTLMALFQVVCKRIINFDSF